ncbi:MAG: PAS domain-containing protein [Bdellovibrionota bacterium]|nr:PAS domain-containing protein [Bdellovibrionota bacterium]
MKSKQKTIEIDESELKILNEFKDCLEASAIVTKTDVKGRIHYVNDLFCEISGYSREELIGSDHRIVCSGHHSKEFFKEMWKTILTGKVWSGEICNRAKDGSLYWVDTKIHPLFGHQGKLEGFLAFRTLISEKKVYEQEILKKNRELEASLSFLKNIQDNASHAIISTDKEGLITSFNKRAEEIYGYSAKEVIGIVTPSIFHSESEVIQRSIEFSEKLDCAIAPGMDTLVCHTNNGLENSFEWTGVHKDGTEFPMVLSITSLMSENGETIGYLGLVQHIGELRELQRKVKAKNNDLEHAQAIAKIGSWSFDITSGEISWSNEMYNIFPEDISNGEPSFERHRSTIHKDDVQMWEETVSKAIEDGKPYKMNFRTFKDDELNEVVWVEARGQGRVVNGKVISLSGTCQDITEAKLREKELKLILESNQVGTWKFNPVSNELFWDDSMYQLFDVNPKDFNGAYDAWVNTLDENDKERAMDEFENALTGDGNFESSFKIKTKANKQKYIGARAIIDRDSDGKPLFVMGINWDQTKEKVAHEKLKLRAIELREAELAAKKAEKSKSEFLANMSHEIRTPMNGMMGMLSLLNQTPLTEDQREMLDTISTSSQALLGLLSDILDISKIEAGKLSVDKEEFSLNMMLKDLKALMSAKAKERGTIIHLEVPKESLWVAGDATRIRQILTNFISNAIKFTHDGLINLKLKYDVNVDGRLLATYSVSDTGKGIAKKNQKKLFDAFVQEDTSITREFGGTGLGLTICAKLSKLLGGKVYFESDVGIGSTFYLEVPLDVVNQREASAPLEAYSSKLSEQYPHQILIVEDNKINQKVVRLTLEKLGYHCDLAGDGQQALNTLKEKGESYYSLILMDMQMPVMDGLSATREIVKRYGDRAPIIVALTANAFKSDMENCLSVGMSDYLSKPLRKKDLVEVLKKFSRKPSLKKIS